MTTNDSRSTPAEPPPPEWIAADLPPHPPVTAPALGPTPTEPAMPRPARWGRAGIAVAVTAAFVAAMIGGGIESRLRTRKPVSTATAAATVAPPTPAAPTSPYPGNSENPTGASPGASTSTGTSNLSSAQTSAIAANVDPAVVDITTKLGYQSASAAGTGVVLTASGEILTNNHVIDGATSITVTLVDSGLTYQATVVGTDPTEDIAVIQLQGASGLKTIKTASAAVAIGDSVVAIGNAGGAGGSPSVVTGTVQAVNQTITASDQGGANAEQLSGLIQTDAPLQPGDSGGPLVNRAGQVIGIDTAASAGNRFASGATVGFAIPIDHAISIANQIESGHATASVHIGLPGFLGVAVTPNNNAGAVVASVASGSPAAGAGLAQGDTITSINGHSVDSAQTLASLTKSHRPGDKVTVGWTDQAGASHTAKVTLATGPAD